VEAVVKVAKAVGDCCLYGLWAPLVVYAVIAPEIARTRHPVTTVGIVQTTDCPNHQDVWFTYTSSGVQKEGASSVAGCNRLRRGDPIHLYNDATDPDNVSAEEARTTAQDFLALSALTTFGWGAILYLGIRRFRQRIER
jgi:hypothetical protein